MFKKNIISGKYMKIWIIVYSDQKYDYNVQF